MRLPCAVPDCDRESHAKTYCIKHYVRWLKHGSPFVVGKPIIQRPVGLWFLEHDLRAFWAKVTLPDEYGCMLWTASLDADGYGRFRLGRGWEGNAHRASLWISDGPPPEGRPEAAHSCRNRHCVAPAHLRWATKEENEADKIRHGSLVRGDAHHCTKITDAEVREIRRRYEAGGVTQKQLGAEFGIHPSRVSMIMRRVARFREEAS